MGKKEGKTNSFPSEEDKGQVNLVLQLKKEASARLSPAAPPFGDVREASSV